MKNDFILTINIQQSGQNVTMKNIDSKNQKNNHQIKQELFIYENQVQNLENMIKQAQKRYKKKSQQVNYSKKNQNITKNLDRQQQSRQNLTQKAVQNYKNFTQTTQVQKQIKISSKILLQHKFEQNFYFLSQGKEMLKFSCIDTDALSNYQILLLNDILETLCCDQQSITFQQFFDLIQQKQLQQKMVYFNNTIL